MLSNMNPNYYVIILEVVQSIKIINNLITIVKFMIEENNNERLHLTY